LSLDVPGDVVECGVLKGAGLMYWLKLLQIHCPGTLKRVVGFDTFTRFAATSDNFEAQQVAAFVQESEFHGVTVEALYDRVVAAGLDRSKCELVAGDIREVALGYVADHPGFRISLLNLDVDLEDVTLAALEAFWPRVVPGGVVIFDEYAVPRWTESHAVDTFFSSRSVKLRTLPWARTPSAYIVKE
jgi:hypothetical protein